MITPLSSSDISKFITKMTKNDAMGPIIALEATVTLGRTLQAYKRGGFDEARERAIEETTGAIVWLGGVKVLNYLGDKALGLILGKNGGNFDVGTDKVLRTPFENFMKQMQGKNFSPRTVSMMKAGKVLASVLIADAFIGLVMPKINQRLTRNIVAKKKEQEAIQAQTVETPPKDSKKSANPTFKGAINVFTNAIENTNTGKLLSTDAGLVSGRMYSARNGDERREIAIRDIGSIYFYMWAQGHVAKLLNFIETGKFSRLNPSSAENLNGLLLRVLRKNGGEMTAENFRKAVLGADLSTFKIPDGIEFESPEPSNFTKFINRFRKNSPEGLQVAKVSQIETLGLDPKLMERIRNMSKLQPLRQGEAVITKQQIFDAMNECAINDHRFLSKAYNNFTGRKYDVFKKKVVDGNFKNEFKYVSEDSLRGLKAQMEEYVDQLCKSATDGKINANLLNSVKKKNLIFSGINFVTGFVVAATFLSTLIPKFQYWVTKKKTGRNDFPGMFEENNNNIKK